MFIEAKEPNLNWEEIIDRDGELVAVNLDTLILSLLSPHQFVMTPAQIEERNFNAGYILNQWRIQRGAIHQMLTRSPTPPTKPKVGRRKK